MPPDQDWVDYFLFDSKQGYCDYFATAMVVLLRAEGVPARVASGFAPGDFDASTGISIVRENHAHTWVEAYFPRYGWITFEPSAIRPVPTRLEEAPIPIPAAAQVTPHVSDIEGLTRDELDELLNIRDQGRPAPAQPFLTTWPGLLLLSLGALLLVGLVGGGLIALAWRRGLGTLAAYQRPYAQLVRLGGWSGMLRARVSDTPCEVAERLGRQVPRARPAIDELTGAYVEGTYASRTATASTRGQSGWPRGGTSFAGCSAADWAAGSAKTRRLHLPPRAHPELLRQWGARVSERRDDGRSEGLTRGNVRSARSTRRDPRSRAST